jgi:hypothetical protein
VNSTLRSIMFIAIAALFLACVSHAQETTVEHSKTDSTAKIEGKMEIGYTVKLTMNPPESRRCQAQLQISYLQKNDMASVESTLNNDDCAASSGSYIVSVRIRDENSETRNIEYEETWQRDDIQPIAMKKEYFAGDNVDVIRVNTKKLRCICTDELPQDEKSIVE